MLSIQNKVIVITGGNGLLGKSMVSILRNLGAVVISADLCINPNDPNSIMMDITNEFSVRETVQYLVEKYERIDGWVNNAYPRSRDWSRKFEDISIESWRQNVDMHLNGYFICCQVVLEEMKKQQKGSLINMSSIYGLLGPDFKIYEGTEMTMPAAYAAIKGGLNNLTRYLASYYGPYQIRVNTVSPGGIFSDQPQNFVEGYIQRVPLGRMAEAEDIVSAVFYLLSEQSKYVTGHNLVVDGGLSII